MVSKRIEKIKNSLFENDREISLERALLYTESWKQTEGMDVKVRRAYALKNILEKHEISLDDYDLLLGIRSLKPRAGIVSCEMSPYWILDELDKFPTREQDRFNMSEEDKKIYREELYPYWEGRSLKDYCNNHMSNAVKDACKTRIVAINQTDKGQGHIIPDYELLLDNGFDALIKELENLLEKEPENEFYKASLITLKASSDYILRYRDLVDGILSEERYKSPSNEEDKKRAEELIEMKRICEKVSKEKPETFYEAVQLFWFMCVVLQHESNASSISVGRFDQYMYKYYRHDIENGVDREYLNEILRCLYLKFNSIVALRSSESAKYFAGFPIGYTIALGGVDERGKDATNELSYIMLELQKDTMLPQPNLSSRVWENSPREFLMKTAEIISLGTGLPQIFNDEANILAYTNRGVSLKDARDYAIVGCVELTIPKKTYGLHDIALFNLLKTMEVTMEENKEGFKDFDEFMNAIKANIAKYVKHMVDGSNIVDIAHRVCAPTPFLSTFIDGCIEKGLDITEGGAIYNFSGVQGIGCPNLSDSLYVIKKAVFEENRLSFRELVEILENNWEGNEVLRQRFINKYSKYGNDDDEVDNLGSELLSFYCDEVEKYENPRGGIFQPGSYTVSAHIPLGEAVGATPDGRMSGEQLADGGLSPMVGRDKNGPTASLKSVGKLDNILTSNGSLLNVKFSPSTLATKEGLMKLVAYIQAFTRLKIQHIQFNVVSVDTLRDAQKHPENYKNLVVRVAGYSAMFIELSEAIQNDIINRSEHVL